jgi:hypothetical protein
VGEYGIVRKFNEGRRTNSGIGRYDLSSGIGRYDLSSGIGRYDLSRAQVNRDTTTITSSLSHT